MRRIKLPRLYPITDCGISGLSHKQQTFLMVAGGARIIQLRDKRTASLDFFNDAEGAIVAARRKGALVIVNDRVDLALTLGADGVHLGQDDLPPTAARRIMGDSAIIGHSTHNLDQVRRAIVEPVDYIAFGPIFGTSTKTNADPVVGLDELRRARELAGDRQIVAIGGITLETAESVLSAGADSVAIIGDLLKDTSTITERIESFLRISVVAG